MNKRLLSAIVILLGFVLYSAMSNREGSGTAGADAADSPLESAFDYYLADMRLDHFAPDGTHSYHLQAERVTHFPDGDYSVLERPAMNWLATRQAPWDLQARSGLLHGTTARGEDILSLEEDVLANSVHPRQGPMTLATDYLDVYLESRELQTLDPVTITSPGMELRSRGAHALLEENRINLLSEVQGHHD